MPVIETSEMKNMLSKRCMTLGPKISDPTFLLGIENDVYHVYPSVVYFDCKLNLTLNMTYGN